MYKPKKAKIISSIWASQVINKYFPAYLDHLRDVEIEDPSIRLQLSEFNELFPNDLPGMPLDRDIYFFIDLDPGTRPISITLYRMSQTVLRDLKSQI